MKNRMKVLLSLVLSLSMFLTPLASMPVYADKGIDQESAVIETLTDDRADASEEIDADSILSTEDLDAKADLEEEEEIADAEAISMSDAAEEAVTEAEEPAGNERLDIDPPEWADTYAIQTTVLNSAGEPSGMYSMEGVIVTQQEDGSYLVRMHQSRKNRNYLAIVPDNSADSAAKAGSHDADWYIGGGADGYWFVIPVASLTDPVYLTFSNTANIAAGKAWSNVMTLVFDTESMTSTYEPGVTAEEMKMDPSLTHAVKTTVVNSAGEVSGMYTMEGGVVTRQEDGSYLLRMHQSRKNRNYLAIVTDNSADSVTKAGNHEVDWYIGSGADGYWFVIPVASLTDPVYLAFSNTANIAAGKAWSNIMTLTLDAAALSATNEPRVTSEEMNVDPAVVVAENPFTDIAAEKYYYDAVMWAVENGVTQGTDASHFSPDAQCTRGQVVTFLWRSAGSPEPTGSNPFADAEASSPFYKAILWAYETGITKGTDATHFSPNATVTRKQFVTFLWRMEGCPESTIANPFADVVSDGSQFTKAILWAVEAGVTKGVDDKHFVPEAFCTRAQVVTFIYRNL